MPNSKPRILLLTHRIPFPPNSGDRIRAYHIIEFLSKYSQIYLGTVSDESWGQDQVDTLSKYCQKVCVSRLQSPSRWLRAIAGFGLGRSVTQGAFYSRDLSKQIDQWSSEFQFDAAMIYCSSMWPYTSYLKTPPRRTVVDLVDVDSQKWRDYEEVARWPKKWVYRQEANRIGQLEKTIAQHAHAVTVVSRDEADLFARLHPGLRATPIGNGVDYKYFKPPSDRSDLAQSSGNLAGELKLVFVGVLDYLPNIQGLEWFCNQVLPLLHASMPQVSLSIVGRRPTKEVQSLEDRPGVRLVGEVPDVRPYVNEAHIAIAPLQIARGVQNKVLEALACGKPVVATEHAATGIETLGGLTVANEPAQWVQAIEELIKPEVYSQKSKAARDQIVERYSWESQLAPLLDLLGIES
jgi:sugar transferase (PEP-CTERM/EpsH1 system associated)